MGQLRFFFLSFFYITLTKMAKNGEVREQMRDSTHRRKGGGGGGWVQDDNRQQKGISERRTGEKKNQLNLCLTVSCELRGEIK